MSERPPGVDPVADHTWCCEHPEPWNYFDSEAEKRLLSGLGRVFRVDPVETSWSLRIAEWAVSERGIPVLKTILAENAVSPKVRRRCHALLRELGEDGREEHGGEKTSNSQVEASLAWDAKGDGVPPGREAVVEWIGRGEAAGDSYCRQWMHSPPSWSLEEETEVLLAASASGRDAPFELLAHRLTSSRRGFAVYDVYEMVRALMRKPPPSATPQKLQSMERTLREQPWWRAKGREERGQQVVVESALSGGERLTQFRIGGKWGMMRRPPIPGGYWQEACSFCQTPWGAQELGRGLRSPELFVRRQAARGLRRHGTPAATMELMSVVRREIRSGRIPLDIEGAEVVRQAMDGVLHHRPDGGIDFVAEVFGADVFRVHDLHHRAALTLGLFGDTRCLKPSPTSHLPAVVEAAVSPLHCRPGDPLEGAAESIAPRLEEWLDAPIPTGSGKTPHLSRVAMSRAMVAAGRAFVERK